jgi:hypothetical protein
MPGASRHGDTIGDADAGITANQAGCNWIQDLQIASGEFQLVEFLHLVARESEHGAGDACPGAETEGRLRFVYLDIDDPANGLSNRC